MAQAQVASTTTNMQEPLSLSATVSRQRLISILIGTLLGMLLAALDQTIVGTALPRIVTDLGGFEHYAWVVTAYLLASTVSVPIYGKLSDIYGRRIFFMAAMVIFLAGSALSGTSQNMTELIIYRAIQGLGAGGLMPIALAIIGDLFPPSERGKWQGLFVAVFGLASIVGPTLGGWLTDNWGWRWVFYVNMPVGVIAILTAGLVLPKSLRRKQHSIDYLGVVTLIAGAVPLLLGFSWAGTQYAWGSWQVILMFAIAAVMFIVFFWLELRVPEPIISPRLFKNSIFLISVISTFLVAAGMFGAILYLPLFVQDVLGNSATNSGVVLTPMMIGFMISSIVAGQLLSRTGRYRILALVGFVVAAVGMFMLSRMGVTTGEGEVVRNMIVTGLGIGVMMSLFTIIVQNAFPYRQLGEVTAGITFFRSIGSTIGVAVMGSLMTNGFQSTLQDNIPQALVRLAATRHLPLTALLDPNTLLSPGALPVIQQKFAALGTQGQVIFQQLIQAIRVSLSSGVTAVFFLGFIIMLVGFFACLFLREIPLRKAHEAQAQAPGPDRSRALLGLTLALMAREAQKPEADPHILATLSNAVDGRYPHSWSEQERGRAVAQDIIEPLAITLLASSVGNGQANGAAQPAEGPAVEAGEAISSGALLA